VTWWYRPIKTGPSKIALYGYNSGKTDDTIAVKGSITRSQCFREFTAY